MRQTNLISSIWKSFYSKSLYQDVYQNWGVGVVGYLFLLIIIYTAIVFYNHNHAFPKTFNMVINELVNQVPTGEVKNGKMTIVESSPYEITLRSDEMTAYHPGKVSYGMTFQPNVPVKDPTLTKIAVFDMTNKVTPDTSAATLIFHSNGYYVITEHKKTNAPLIQVKKQQSLDESGAQNAYQFKFYPTKAQVAFSKAKAQKWASEVEWILPFIVMTFICIGQFIFKLLQAVVYAFIGLIFSALCKVKLTYGQAYRLSIVSTTPAFFLVTLSSFFLDIQHAWLIAFIIEMGYLFFAVSANRSNHLSKSY